MVAGFLGGVFGWCFWVVGGLFMEKECRREERREEEMWGKGRKKVVSVSKKIEQACLDLNDTQPA